MKTTQFDFDHFPLTEQVTFQEVENRFLSLNVETGYKSFNLKQALPRARKVKMVKVVVKDTFNVLNAVLTIQQLAHQIPFG